MQIKMHKYLAIRKYGNEPISFANFDTISEVADYIQELRELPFIASDEHYEVYELTKEGAIVRKLKVILI